jgi:hypothetical protein
MVRTESQMVYSAKTRARRKNIPLTIEAKDIFIPEACPICDTALKVSNGGVGSASDSSPSLDRIDSRQGYHPRNIWVLCNRCNQQKNNATPAEMYRVADAVYAKIRERRLCTLSVPEQGGNHATE